jgi:DNA-binding CsgD family transcriptional regulator
LLLSSREIQHLLVLLEAKGLVTHSPERLRRYIPAVPDIVLNALLLQRQEELQRAEGAIRELQEESIAQQQGKQEQMIELLPNSEAVYQTYEKMLRVAQQEVLHMVRLPMLITRLDVSPEPSRVPQREAQNRGVHFRGLVDMEYLSYPGTLKVTREDMKAGEEIRVIPYLPLKMVLIDRRLALIPLNLQKIDSLSLLIRSSTLLNTFHDLFEILWKQAVPISFTSAGTLEHSDSNPRLSEEEKDLISLLAAGLNDKNIAHELGISTRTLQRNITKLVQALNVRTRFQLGWLSALLLSATGSIMGVQGSSGK